MESTLFSVGLVENPSGFRGVSSSIKTKPCFQILASALSGSLKTLWDTQQSHIFQLIFGSPLFLWMYSSSGTRSFHAEASPRRVLGGGGALRDPPKADVAAVQDLPESLHGMRTQDEQVSPWRAWWMYKGGSPCSGVYLL